MSEKRSVEAGAVSFVERLASSQLFAALFGDGMALVDETATYLDGPGRLESKKLERSAGLVYATESLRLTNRLMHLASWLLLHRAVKEGEITLAQANKEKAKVSLAACAPGQAADRGAPARRNHARCRGRENYDRQSGWTSIGSVESRFRIRRAALRYVKRAVYFFKKPENFFWKRDSRPPRSTRCCWPPVQAGCDFGSISRCSVSPDLPQVERVVNSVPSVMTTLMMW